MSADAACMNDAKAEIAAGACRLLEWAAGCELADIPNAVLARAATVLADDLAAMIGARDEPEVARFHARVIERARHREATVLRGGNARVARIDAAVANAVAADWLELDEGYRPTPCHAGLYVLPALLATAEAENRRCDELLRAIALGYEVVTRIARAWRPRALNMQSHGRYSAIGAAAATALLQRLDADTMFQAVAAAATLTNPSPRSHLVAGALVRNVWPAQGAWSGMMAVEWAGCGIGGSRDGLFDVYSDVLGGTPEPANLTEGTRHIVGAARRLHEDLCLLPAPAFDRGSAARATAYPARGLAAGRIELVEIATHELARPLMNQSPIQRSAQNSRCRMPWPRPW